MLHDNGRTVRCGFSIMNGTMYRGVHDTLHPDEIVDYITMAQTRPEKSPISGYPIVLKTLSQEQQWAEAALPYVGNIGDNVHPFVLTRYIRPLGL